MNPINISEKFKLFDTHWTPKKIGTLNGQQILLAKLKGAFIWHAHADEDELFMIIKGCLKIELRDKMVTVNQGEIFIIPKGVAHRPIAEEEVYVLLFEPLSTKHTGAIINELTVETYESI
jgi:mannose-6-phosphate isomerase-like protein (cupin superfamily)